MLVPMIIVLLLATVYARFADLPVVHGAFDGVAAAASGLMLAMGVRMGRTVKNSRIGIAIAAVSFAAIGLARLATGLGTGGAGADIHRHRVVPA